MTHHRVWVDGELVADLRGETTHHKPMGHVSIGRPGRTVRVETVESPSWVAWSKIHVFGARLPEREA